VRTESSLVDMVVASDEVAIYNDNDDEQEEGIARYESASTLTILCGYVCACMCVRA